MMQKSPSWMASDAEGQEKQRDNIIQKAKILCFQGHTKSFAIQQGIFLYHVTVRILKRAHRIACVNGGGGRWGVGPLRHLLFSRFPTSKSRDSRWRISIA